VYVKRRKHTFPRPDEVKGRRAQSSRGREEKNFGTYGSLEG